MKFPTAKELAAPALAPALLLLLLVSAPPAPARQSGAEAQSAPAAKKEGDDQPVFRAYRGVQIGMAADEARRKLGSPTDKGDKQDFYSFSDHETAQVFYDASRKVSAISVSYFGDVAKAPAPKAVLGSECETKPDGSAYKMVRYPKAGYWVSYSRTAGDSPLVAVVMQKIP